MLLCSAAVRKDVSSGSSPQISDETLSGRSLPPFPNYLSLLLETDHLRVALNALNIEIRKDKGDFI